LRVEAEVLPASVGDPEAPHEPDTDPVPLRLPRPDLRSHRLLAGEPAVQALPAQHAQLALRYVQPAGVLRREVELQPAGQTPRLLGPVRGEERPRHVRVQVVDEVDPLARPIIYDFSLLSR